MPIHTRRGKKTMKNYSQIRKVQSEPPETKYFPVGSNKTLCDDDCGYSGNSNEASAYTNPSVSPPILHHTHLHCVLVAFQVYHHFYVVFGSTVEALHRTVFASDGQHGTTPIERNLQVHDDVRNEEQQNQHRERRLYIKMSVTAGIRVACCGSARGGGRN